VAGLNFVEIIEEKEQSLKPFDTWKIFQAQKKLQAHWRSTTGINSHTESDLDRWISTSRKQLKSTQEKISYVPSDITQDIR
jgi:hypothetical protein